MRKLWVLKLFAVPLLALLLSCSKKEKEQLLTGSPTSSGDADSTAYGRVSIAKGSGSASSLSPTQGTPVKKNNVSSLAPDACASDYVWQLPFNEVQLAKLTVKSIEFSPDEVNWISLTDVPFEITLDPPTDLAAKLSKINVGPFLVPAGDYKGIRIKLAPGVTVLKTLSGESYPCQPDDFPQAIISVGTSNWDNGVLEEIIFNQSNDRSRISPFTIQAGKDSYLLFEIYISQFYKSQWTLWWRSVKVSDTF